MRNTLKVALVTIIGLFVLTGCSRKHVETVSKNNTIKHICIEHNPTVIVQDFIPTVQNIFKHHGIDSTIYNYSEMPKECKITMIYTANQTWDFTMFMHFAELSLFENSERIGFVQYKVQHGFDLSKFYSIHSKMSPLIAQMLSEQNNE